MKFVTTAIVCVAFVSGALSFSVSTRKNGPYRIMEERPLAPCTSRGESFERIVSLAMTASIYKPQDFGGGNLNNHQQLPSLNQSPPRSICLMVEPTPFTHISGYANRFNEMLRFLSKAGDNVKVLTVDEGTPRKEQPKHRFGYSIEHTFGFSFPLYNQISLSFDFPQMKGRKILQKMKPDIIHVSSPGFLVVPAILYARIMRIPLVMSYHTHVPMYAGKYLGYVPWHKRIIWALLRWAHTKADLTLCTSPQMKAELVANGIPRVDVWRKGVDSDRFNPAFRCDEMRKTMTDGNPDDFLIVSVGRIGAEKRLKDIKPMLEKMGPGVRLCIVGKGPQLEHLKKYYKGTNTVFTGQLLGDELSKVFASADAFIMPSDTETLGFVVMESMASAVPVVGARAGGVPDMIKDGENGFLVPAGDTDAFVNRLERLRNDPKLRKKMGEAARVEAKKWRWEDATSVLRNIQYETAMRNFTWRLARRLSRRPRRSSALYTEDMSPMEMIQYCA